MSKEINVYYPDQSGDAEFLLGEMCRSVSIMESNKHESQAI